MNKKIAVVFGDGVGPEVTQQSIKVLNTVAMKYRHSFEFKFGTIGADAINKTGDPLPQETIDLCRQCDAVLFGAVGLPQFDNDPFVKIRPEQGLLRLRHELELFASIRPVTSYPALYHISPLRKKLLTAVDFVIYRELSQGIYFGKKEINEAGTVASDECVYTKPAIERITRKAFIAAMQRRKKLTLVDKTNVLATSRLWRKTVQEIAVGYPDVTVDYLFVDNAAMQLIINPGQFDVILTDNMFGDILSDEASVICGSLGLLPSASVGDKYALFEPIHGSYPKAAGKDIANPVGSILSAAMMLDYFGLEDEAAEVREAVEWTLFHGFVSQDIDPVNAHYTSTIGEFVSDFISDDIPENINAKNIAFGKATII